MVTSLYYVLDFVFAIVLLVILHHDRSANSKYAGSELAFRWLLLWVVFFCLQDAVWGFMASEEFKMNWPLVLSSSIFHVSTAVTTFFWLNFVIHYLDGYIRHPRFLILIDAIIVTAQVALVIVNFFTPVIFRVHDGTYYASYLRPLAFSNQYIVYIFISLVMFLGLLGEKGQRREKFAAGFMFTLFPVLTGVFQLLYPDGPYFALGYFLGCFVIHIYVVTNDRDELKRQQAQREMKEQIKISNTDSMTGLWNRRYYESVLMEIASVPAEENFVFLAIDINGLKNINDTLGHDVGDELIVGAAECLKSSLSKYGRVFRVGGDEFVAMINATDVELRDIRRNLEESIQSWHGRRVKSLAMSYGFVSKREYPKSTVRELARIADERMYADKEIYYNQKGIDRRGQQSAFSALCSSYTKILKINLTDDRYRIIRMDTSEQNADMGFANNISDWLHNFGTSGHVHPDDLENYLAQTDHNAMQRFFAENHRNLNIFYRRKSADGSFRLTKMEMIPAEDYRLDNMSLYLYVKDIDK